MIKVELDKEKCCIYQTIHQDEIDMCVNSGFAYKPEPASYLISYENIVIESEFSVKIKNTDDGDLSFNCETPSDKEIESISSKLSSPSDVKIYRIKGGVNSTLLDKENIGDSISIKRTLYVECSEQFDHLIVNGSLYVEMRRD